MGENKGADDGVVVGLTEEQKQEMVRNQNFHKMRFWICCNLFEILFLLAAPFLIFFCDKMQYPRWTQYLYHYTGSQIFLLLIVLAISLAEVFYIFFIKDIGRLETLRWLVSAGAFMMGVAFCLFAKEVGYPSLNEKKLYWFILICLLLHIVACKKIFNAYKNLWKAETERVQEKRSE